MIQRPSARALRRVAMAAALVPGLAVAGTSLISSIGADKDDPSLAAASSKYFTTDDAGIVREGRNLGYYWTLKPVAKLEAPLYLKATWENPCGESLVNDATLEQGTTQVFGLSSPAFVLGLKEASRYTLKVEVFHAKGDAEPVDTIEQAVLSPLTAWGCN